MNKKILQLQYHRLSSVYRKLKLRFDKALKENRFKDYSLHKQRQLISRLEKLRSRLASLQQLLKLSGSALALGLILNSGDAHSQTPTPIGNEFQVNTFTTGYQIFPTIAMDSDGDYVVTWGSGGQDGGGYGIFAQRYNASGVAQGSEFQVNTFTTGDQSNPSIAMDSDGDFVIVWTSYGQDGYYGGIYAQRYNASGVAQGSEFLVNTYTYSDQNNPSVAMDSDGDFVITWESYLQDGSYLGVYAQRYDASGVQQGSEFQVNTYTTYTQFKPTVAMDSDGDFVIAWTSYYQNGEYSGVYAQRYNASGVAQGSEFRVNANPIGYKLGLDPAVAMDTDGDFVVTWENYQYGGGFDNYARRFNASGIAQGNEFQVNTNTVSHQLNPTIAMDSEGDFVITWHTYNYYGNFSVYAQRYNSSGVALGDEFQVNTFTASYQIYPTIAMDSDGDFVISWFSYGQDGDAWGVYAKRYSVHTPIIFDQTFSINENSSNGTLVNTVIASDPDLGQTLTYAITAGNDDNKFAINSITGEITVNGSLDFETTSSYALTVAVTDDGAPALSSSAIITINVNDVNEGPPTDITLSASTVNENVAANTIIGILSTTDIDGGDSFTYTLVAGIGDTDNASFNISGSNLRITNSPDFETKSNYSIRIRSTDQGNLTFEKVFTITINNINEAPTDISLSTSSVDENVAANTTVATFSTTDPDAGNTFTYTLVTGTGDTDNASFNINGSNLRITNSPDHETKSSYSVRVRTTDQGSLTFEKVFTITINDLTETGVPKAYANSQINIYPNPSTGMFSIKSNGLSLDAHKVIIMNVMGETVYESQFAEQLDLQQLTKGVYTLMLENEKGIIVKQIVIQ